MGGYSYELNLKIKDEKELNALLQDIKKERYKGISLMDDNQEIFMTMEEFMEEAILEKYNFPEKYTQEDYNIYVDAIMQSLEEEKIITKNMLQIFKEDNRVNLEPHIELDGVYYLYFNNKKVAKLHNHFHYKIINNIY